MHASWQSIVAPQILQSDAQQSTSWFAHLPFPDPDRAARIALTHLACLQLQGPDTVKFLQGQITQDARQILQRQGFFTDFCNPKGRILASALVVPQADDQALLLLPHDNAEFLRQHLSKYLVFSKVSLTALPELLALAQHQPGAHLPPWQTNPTADGAQMAISESLGLVLGRADTIGQHWQATDAQAAGQRFWQLLQLRQGRAWVDAGNRERYTPHQLNHQLIGAINFKKGCYTGQEVVARMHYKATLKNHLYAFSLNSAQAPALHQAVQAPDGPVGELVSCAQQTQERWLVLVDIRLSAREQPLSLADLPGQILQPVQLPYAINKQANPTNSGNPQ